MKSRRDVFINAPFGSEAIIVKARGHEKRGFFALKKSARLEFGFDQRALTYVIVEPEKRVLRAKVMDIRSFRASTKSKRLFGAKKVVESGPALPRNS